MIPLTQKPAMSVLLEADYTHPHCPCLIVHIKKDEWNKTVCLSEAEYPVKEYHGVFQKWQRVTCYRVNTKSGFVGFAFG